MTYPELNQCLEEKITQLPIFYAFNQDQFAEGCKKLAVEIPKEELCSIGFGGFMLKKNLHEWIEAVSNSNKMREEFLSVHENLVDAFRYELANHEYIVTLDPTDTWEALGLDINNTTEFQCKAFVEAKDTYLNANSY